MTGTFGELLALLPVRPPMVLVDRITSLQPGVRIEVDKAVSGSEPCYAGMAEGLAPECYAYPRSLIMESFGQAAVLLWLKSVRPSGAGPALIPMAGRLRRCSFAGHVLPGDVIRHTVHLEAVKGDNAFMAGVSRVAGRTILRVESLLTVARPTDMIT